MNRDFPLLQRVDFGLIGIDTSDMMSKIRETRPRYEAHIASANHGNSHCLSCLATARGQNDPDFPREFRRALAVQDRLAVQMLRKEKEIIDVSLPRLAPPVRQQRAGVLQLVGIEVIDGDHVVIP